jgi:hypothetical protein
MADKEIPPYRCTSCFQAIPEDHNQYLFASYSHRPTSDDAGVFITEAQTILGYASAVAQMFNAAVKISDEVVTELQALVGELTEEAHRRLERAQDAYEIEWECTHDPDTGERKAGV